jgi:hypothetical protein
LKGLIERNPQRSSGGRDAEAPDKWLGDDKFAIDDLQRKRCQTAGGWTINDRRSLARIVP